MNTCQGCGVEIPLSRGPVPRKWCSNRCRKHSYGQPCIDCGARTSYGAESAHVDDPRCSLCARLYYKVWTREAILCAIQEWSAEHDEPPAIADWNAWQTRTWHDDKRAQRYQQEKNRWPSHMTVAHEFGTWSAAIKAAGFQPRANHGGAGNELRRRSAKVAA
jgi:hypothetical protein